MFLEYPFDCDKNHVFRFPGSMCGSNWFKLRIYARQDVMPGVQSMYTPVVKVLGLRPSTLTTARLTAGSLTKETP